MKGKIADLGLQLQPLERGTVGSAGKAGAWQWQCSCRKGNFSFHGIIQAGKELQDHQVQAVANPCTVTDATSRGGTPDLPGQF